ncbi:HAMP domain-containing sensor histidine kinase [Sulfuritalea hydrogenivorans]|uniref:Signal transduction histidine-protein kinase/phosphatase MprB n=1 Tax=Sulfuritalea hydrogenivorans sk43H TaxID=1223802 RepID=W0SBD8_9PROT|nr:ATP-binding protein [Sulfuritalea hydrogenivorans]BAO28306.1 integral membrane sensor signal transduction histidine kinase [Sulfuritalea hydrogenivorans sk43H]
MGRLFWKFFFIFWLAQVVTSVGVGVAIWLERPAHMPGAGAFAEGPPPPRFGGPDHPPPLPDRPPPPPHYLSLPLLPILAGCVVSLLFAALLAWYFAKPIRSLRSAFESVAGGKLGTRIGASMGRRKDELADLGKDFDHMADRLQNLLDAQRRLLHDVSHELRSPLARLQAAADLMRQQPERGAEFIERIERDTARMDKLVGELLTLARLDAGMTGKLDEDVDLREVVTDISADARFEADGKHCAIEVDLNGPVVARGSHELLYRAIENVVRNAVLHSPEGGIVAISAHSADGRLRVTVADGGPGVFDGDLAAIFDPFFRSDPGQSVAGYGLGLAITRRVVEAHGGSVSAANQVKGGLMVTLLLPLPVRAGQRVPEIRDD